MTTKIAVSLPDEQVAAARAAVAEGRAPSVSAYVSEALARRSAEEELLQLLDEDEAAGEPTTEEHRAWARRALDAEPAPAARGAKRASGRERVPGAHVQTGSTAKTATGRYGGKPSTARSPSTSVSEPSRNDSRRG